MKTNVIYQGKFQEQAEKIEPGSVDLILTDPPYGTVNGLGDNESVKHGMKDKTEWDNMIDPKEIYDCANRILRKNGKLVLFSQQPYTTILIDQQISNLPHNYNMVWYKDHFANSLIAKEAPVKKHEDILIFSKEHDVQGLHPLRKYFAKVKDSIGLGLKDINRQLGHRKAEHSFYIDSTQFSLCTRETYKELIKVFDIDKMEGFKSYSELREIDKKYDSVFNLSSEKKYKSSVLEYAKDYDGHHPTQKPIALLEDLIKTFSNKGDLVVDLTTGSGSTGMAVKNCGCKYILIEQKQEYVDVAKERLSEVQKELIR